MDRNAVLGQTSEQVNKTAFLCSVQFVHSKYFLLQKIRKKLHPTECEQYLNESPPLALDINSL